MSGSHHGAHEQTSSDELEPDEPRTPMWLPLLGIGLFVAALIFAMSGDDEPAPESDTATPSADTAAGDTPDGE